MRTFKHSGDLGDIVFSLPVIRAMGGGLLYLDPEGGRGTITDNERGRTKLSADAIDSIKPVLLQQRYIDDVRHWRGEPVEHDLDRFRQNLRFNNLSDSHLAAFGLANSHRDHAWIDIADPIRLPDRPIVITRSVRYHSNDIFWQRSLTSLKDRCVFVGYPKEYEIFCYTFEMDVVHCPTPDILSLAQIIAGCDRFIGNQGLAHALAEGMKKNLINEVFRVFPSGIFIRPGAQYV